MNNNSQLSKSCCSFASGEAVTIVLKDVLCCYSELLIESSCPRSGMHKYAGVIHDYGSSSEEQQLT